MRPASPDPAFVLERHRIQLARERRQRTAVRRATCLQARARGRRDDWFHTWTA